MRVGFDRLSVNCVRDVCGPTRGIVRRGQQEWVWPELGDVRVRTTTSSAVICSNLEHLALLHFFAYTAFL